MLKIINCQKRFTILFKQHEWRDFMREFLHSWINVLIEEKDKKNQNTSDKIWDQIYESIIANNDTELIFSGNWLFRLYTTWDNKTKYVEQNFKNEHYFFKNQNNTNTINFNNQWLPFTDSIDVIKSIYIAEEQEYFVMVIQPEKAINIYPLKKIGVDERIVIAPMNESTVVEILSLDKFIKKYSK